MVNFYKKLHKNCKHTDSQLVPAIRHVMSPPSCFAAVTAWSVVGTIFSLSCSTMTNDDAFLDATNSLARFAYKDNRFFSIKGSVIY